MGSPKQRENRQVVFVAARLRSDDGWSDITICNISSRGLMAKASAPPPKGTFVEVRRGTICVVGHVRWSQGARFGLRSQDRIDVRALCADQPALRRPRHNDRRTAPRTAAPPRPQPSLAEREERSRRLARGFEWGALAVAGIAAAALLAQMAATTLSQPLREVRAAMQVANP